SPLDLVLGRLAVGLFTGFFLRDLAFIAEEDERRDIELVGIALTVLVGALAIERPDEHTLRATPATFLQLSDEMAYESGLTRAADCIEHYDVGVSAVPRAVKLGHLRLATE